MLVSFAKMSGGKTDILLPSTNRVWIVTSLSNIPIGNTVIIL